MGKYVYSNGGLIGATGNVAYGIWEARKSTFVNSNAGLIGTTATANVLTAPGIWDIRKQEIQVKDTAWPPTLPWNRQRPITITSTPSDSFQVRIALTTGNFDYSMCNSDGSDIRFMTVANGNPLVSTLTYWNESWNSTGTSVFWVKVPSTGTTTIYMRYGNAAGIPTASSFTDTLEQNKVRYRYYGGTGFTTLDGGGLTTVPNVNWGSGTVTIDGFGSRADSLSIVWDGYVMPSGSGTYTFYGTSDDGQRLYIGGTTVINNWTDQSPTERSGTYSWTDGLPKTFNYQFYENGGGAYAACGWTPPSTATKVYPIPTTNIAAPKYGTGYTDTFNMSGTVGSESVLTPY